MRAGLSAAEGAPLRILVTRLRYLGDIVLTTPLIEAVGECFPGAEVWYMAEPPYASILEGHPALAGIIEAGGGAAVFSTIRRLRKLKFAAAIDLFYNPRSANILRLSGIPVRVGGGRRWRRRLYTDLFEARSGSRSAIVHHLSALDVLGCEAGERKPKVYLGVEERRAGKALVDSLTPGTSVRTVAVHAGGTWPAKRWSRSSFARLAASIRDRYGAGSLLVTGPGEEGISREVAEASKGAAAVLPVMPIRETAAAIAACDALVSNDGGVMHTGVALGVPTVGIFGPTDPGIWFPYRGMGPFDVVTAGVDCSPCDLHECCDMRCLDDITVETVADALGKVTGWME